MDNTLGFNWKSIVGTVISTIGTVATQFLTDANNDGMVLYQFNNSPQRDDETAASGVFMKDKNGKLVFFNNSVDQSCIITLSFPRIGNAAPETITLSPMDYVEVEQYFKNAVKYDTTEFMLSACNATPENGGGFHIAASGSAVQIGKEPEAKRIGNYLTVKCYPEYAEFTAVNHKMQQLSAVTLRGDNDSRIRASRIPAQVVEGDYVATLNFPSPLPEGSSVEIDVEADMLNLEQVLEEQRKQYQIFTMSPDEAKEACERIRAFQNRKEA